VSLQIGSRGAGPHTWGLPRFTPHQKVLVGNETHDDAGVYWLNDQEALVQTIDYFTPVVDDAQLFGRIAAVNSLSDVYAMGGRPITALNLLGLPSGKLPPEMVSAMLTGGTRVMESAGVAVLGGHSVDDPEPKMGYAVTGLVHPDHIWRNSTSRVGDRLYLTKPIGTGLIIKAMKDSVAQSDEIEAATAMMTHPNQAAAEAIKPSETPRRVQMLRDLAYWDIVGKWRQGRALRSSLIAHGFHFCRELTIMP